MSTVAAPSKTFQNPSHVNVWWYAGVCSVVIWWDGVHGEDYFAGIVSLLVPWVAFRKLALWSQRTLCGLKVNQIMEFNLRLQQQKPDKAVSRDLCLAGFIAQNTITKEFDFDLIEEACSCQSDDFFGSIDWLWYITVLSIHIVTVFARLVKPINVFWKTIVLLDWDTCYTDLARQQKLYM